MQNHRTKSLSVNSFSFPVLLLLSLAAPVLAAGIITRPIFFPIYSPVSNQNQFTWVRFEPNDESFSVLMPKQPSRESAQVAGLTGDVYSASGGKIYYRVEVFNVGASEGAGARMADFILRYRKELSQSPGVKVSIAFTRNVSFGSFSGEQYQVANGRLRGLVRFYAGFRKIYVLEVVGGDEADAPVKWFLESFTINERPASSNSETAINKKPWPPVPLPSPSPSPSPTPDQKCDCEPASNQILTSQRITRDAIICEKPELKSSNIAIKNRYSGTVVLRVELAASGEIGNIEVVKPQPYGLTELAVEAAQQYKFCPALLDGVPVTQYMNLECDFTVKTIYVEPPSVKRPTKRRP